ncbi:MAG: hypothetical protein ABI348_01480, partial [Nitrososphaera sp.]
MSTYFGHDASSITSGNFVERQLTMQVGDEASKAGSVLPVKVIQDITLQEQPDQIDVVRIFPEWQQGSPQNMSMTLLDKNGNSVVDGVLVDRLILSVESVDCGSN